MKRRAPPNSQRGVALVALLVMVVLAGGYAFYRSANLGGGKNQERDAVLQRLVQAKESVIAYAINDSTRPGRLLCPDILGDGNTPKFTQDDCPAYGGWLPWSTLNLPDSTDAQGARFRYFLSPAFGGKSVKKLLNSETITTLRLDVPGGAASNDIAAVIIATRGAIDVKNGDGDDYFYNSNPDDSDNNDIVIAITRQELMAAVEQRIANELRSCLEQHASSSENLQQTYPWPAPLSNAIYKGASKSLFGMVPDTQPGNPEMALKTSITKLANLQNSLNWASTAEDQLKVVTQIQTEAAYARLLFDRLYLLAVDVADKADQANKTFAALDNTIIAATTNKAVFIAQGGSLPGAITTATPSLAAFIDSIKNSGFDFFIMEMEEQNFAMKQLIDAAQLNPTQATVLKLITPINLFKNQLLDNSWSPNQEIETPLSAAYNAASKAATAVNNTKINPTDGLLLQHAIDQSTALFTANGTLQSTILASRFNVDSNEISFVATQVTAAKVALSSSFSTKTLATLTSALESAQTTITPLTSGSTNLNNARATALSALSSALLAAKAGQDQLLIRDTSDNAAAQLNALANAMLNNGDNLAEEALKFVAGQLNTAQQSAPKNVTTARALRTPVSTVLYWAGVAGDRSAKLALLARKGISSQEDSDASAYTAARKLLASLDGETGSIALLNKYNNSSTSSAAQAAQDALNNTQALLSSVLAAASTLDKALETSMAEAAIPTIWYSNACQFLKPPTGDETWWKVHEWKKLFFYQISDRIRPTIGKLGVNGNENYRTVAISAGKALTVTDKSARTGTSRLIKNYLEGKNADNSRDGDAQSPSPKLFVEPTSPVFNDRLAY